MRLKFIHWFKNIPFTQPLLRRQALLLQAWILMLLLAVIPAIPISLVGGGTGIGPLLRVLSALLCGIGLLISFVALRRGYLQASIVGVMVSLSIIQTLSLIVLGLEAGAIVLLVAMISFVLTGLLSSRRIMLMTFLLNVGCLALIVVLESQNPPLAGFDPPVDTAMWGWVILIDFVLIGAVIMFFLDRFAQAFRENLVLAQQREQQLDQLQQQQATIIAERTHDLEAALKESRHQQQNLQATLEALELSQATVQSLTAPLIPILPGVVVVPLTGQLDAQRIAELTDQLLEMVATQHSQYVIIDVTGLSVIDEVVAGGIHALAAGLNLMGTGILLVGIRPEVAQTMVSLGLDTYRWRTYANLQAAVQVLVQRVAA